MADIDDEIFTNDCFFMIGWMFIKNRQPKAGSILQLGLQTKNLTIQRKKTLAEV